MPSARQCARCKMDLDSGATQGLCPRCLIALSLTVPTEAPTGFEDPDVEVHSTHAQNQRVPLPEEIAPHFPQLEILEFLGRGGMGVVYKARQPKLNRLVALKLLAPEKEANPKFAERFAREAQALARLSHPNIVAVYDFGETNGQFFLLMEYVDGLSLRQLLRTGHLPPETALSIVPSICDALQYAHQAGIVHRDIKPENILRDKDGRVKIADFGIAKMISPNQGSITQDQQVVGTPHYMAPEQVEKPELVDHRADIYSLGVIFYEMLTGELPLGKFQPPSKKAQLDVRLDQVVMRALAKEPEQRYQKVSDIKTQLDTIVSNPDAPVGSAHAVPGEETIATRPPSYADASKDAVPGFLSRFGFLKIAAAVALLLVSCLTLYLKRSQPSSAVEQSTGGQLAANAATGDQKIESIQMATRDAGQRAYQGGFVEQPLTLAVQKLPPHKLLRINFDLSLAGSWDDSSTNLDEKLWEITLADGRRLLHTTFANAGVLAEKAEQAFPDAHPCRPHPARTGSIDPPTPAWPGSGRTWDLSSVYRFVFALPHTNSEATLHFKAPAITGAKDKSYGIANLQVIAAPELTEKTEQELSSLWKELGSLDPQRSFKAQWDLIASGDTAVNYISHHLEESIDLPPTTIQGLIEDLKPVNPQLANAAQTALIGQGRAANVAVARAIAGDGPPPESIQKLVNIQWSIANYPETPTELRLHRARQALLAIHTPAAQSLAKEISPDHYQPKPSIPELLQAGKAAGMNGDWPKAAEAFEKLAAAGAVTQHYWIWATAAALTANQTNTHLRLCRGYLRRFGDSTDPTLAHRFAKQCLGAPWVSGDLLERSSGLAEFVVKTFSTPAWSSVAKGMAEYRQGNWSNALEWLSRPERTATIDNSTLALAVSAMARFQLGHAASARRSLEELNRRLSMYVRTGELSEILEGEWDNKALAFALRAEAERLIMGREVSPPLNPVAVAESRARWHPIRGLMKSGEELASQRKWAEASDAFTAALAAPGFAWDLYEKAPFQRTRLAVASLMASNETRYIDFCRVVLERTNSEVPVRAVEAYAVVALANPGALPPDLQARALAYARQACQRSEIERSFMQPLLQGLLAYRERQYSNTLAALTGKEAIYDPITKARAVAIRGMAHFRLGQIEQARRALEKAEAYLSHGPSCCIDSPEWWGVGLGEVELRELRALLGVRERPDPHLSGAITVGSASEVGRLTLAGTVTGAELNGVVDLTLSTNGQFLYAASHIVGAIGVYNRDPISGQLTSVQFVRGGSNLNGAISIRLSPDQRYAVAAAMRSKAVVLFKRDLESGRLEQLGVIKKQDGVQGLNFPVRARFSLDGKYIYALDGGNTGGITAFGFIPDRGFQWLQTFTNNFTVGGSRALAMLPDGKSILVVNHRSHTLTLFDRDPVSGKVSLRQGLSDEDAGASQIEGQFGVTVTREGKFVYVCSGRFWGDNAVSAFRVTDEGKLTPLQAVVNGQDGLTFIGGNEVIVTRDGLNVYATATVSGTLACFARDPQNGRLRLIQSFVNDKRTVLLDGPAGLECSPDGRFVYVPTEWQKGISIYRRELTPLAK